MTSILEKKCIERGLRMTEQRRIIAQVLSEATDHPDAEEVYTRATLKDPKISLATVYRTVRLFDEAGIIETHDFRDGRRKKLPKNSAMNSSTTAWNFTGAKRRPRRFGLSQGQYDFDSMLGFLP